MNHISHYASNEERQEHTAQVLNKHYSAENYGSGDNEAHCAVESKRLVITVGIHMGDLKLQSYCFNQR